jgi:hypothetical protein
MSNIFKPVDTNLPAKVSFWGSVKAFLTVELTPKQQKMEREINEFLYQEVTWQKIHDFLFQEITFGKKNKKAQSEIMVDIQE